MECQAAPATRERLDIAHRVSVTTTPPRCNRAAASRMSAADEPPHSVYSTSAQSYSCLHAIPSADRWDEGSAARVTCTADVGRGQGCHSAATPVQGSSARVHSQIPQTRTVHSKEALTPAAAPSAVLHLQGERCRRTSHRIAAELDHAKQVAKNALRGKIARVALGEFGTSRNNTRNCNWSMLFQPAVPLSPILLPKAPDAPAGNLSRPCITPLSAGASSAGGGGAAAGDSTRI